MRQVQFRVGGEGRSLSRCCLSSVLKGEQDSFIHLACIKLQLGTSYCVEHGLQGETGYDFYPMVSCLCGGGGWGGMD